MFFVIGDRKTPDLEVVEFLRKHVPYHAYYGIDRQHNFGYKCSRLIGENSIQRRNIGFLEALKWGADIVVSVDDDNACLNKTYFSDFESVLGCSRAINKVTVKSGGSFSHTEIGYELGPVVWNGLKASSPSGWFDVGTLLQPKAPHRGFPHTKKAEPAFAPVTDAKIGVAAGICLGDPDVSAYERIANAPVVYNVSEVLRSGIVVDPRETWTVFNSQNTAVIRELVPAWFMLSGTGRADDIFASLVVQRAMRQTGNYTHFGMPFVLQQRNVHDLVRDLEQEVWGMQHILEFAHYLEGIEDRDSVVELVRAIYEHQLSSWFPQQTCEAALAWCDDCEQVLK
jgi:hypothetical protein